MTTTATGPADPTDARSAAGVPRIVGPTFRGSGTSRLVRFRPPDQAVVPVASTQGTLALRFGAEPDPVHRPDQPAALRSVTSLRAELDTFAKRFCAAVVEVVGGDRGPQQLLRWTTPEVYEDLVRRSAAVAGTTASDQRLRRLRAQVRSVHLFCPTARSAELSVHVRHGHRSRAIAARLEHVEGRWTCVALQFG
jgi:hypothetical protein